MLVLFETREAGCLREVAALHSDQFIQVPLPYKIEPQNLDNILLTVKLAIGYY